MWLQLCLCYGDPFKMNVLLAQLQFKKYITTINNHDDVVKQKQASPKQIEASASFVTNAKAITNVLNYIL